jgi:predicted RNA binding protein YcfA (HicA-like mRNA interferase family)
MRLPVVTPKRFIRILLQIGCIEKRQSGSHRIFYYPAKGVIVSVPMHTRDLKKGLLRSVLKDIDMSARDLVQLMKERR